MWSDDEHWDFEAAADQECDELAQQCDHCDVGIFEEPASDPPESYIGEDIGQSIEMSSPMVEEEQDPPAAEPVAAALLPVAETPDVKHQITKRRLSQKTPDKEERASSTDAGIGDSPAVSGSSSPSSASAKRRRLSVKTADPTHCHTAGNLMCNLEPVALARTDEEWWRTMSATQKNRWMGQRLRSEVVLKYQQDVLKRTKKKQQWRPCWRMVPEKHKSPLVEFWVTNSRAGNECPKVVLGWFRKNTSGEDDLQQSLPKVCRMQSKQLFLTYNGPWGIVVGGSEPPRHVGGRCRADRASPR